MQAHGLSKLAFANNFQTLARAVDEFATAQRNLSRRLGDAKAEANAEPDTGAEPLYRIPLMQASSSTLQ